MYCKDFRQLLDSYISDELLIETNHDVLRHLEDCGDCRRELAAHRDLRSQLRRAVMASGETQINRAFASRVKRELHERALNSRGWMSVWNLSGAFRSRALALSFGALLITAFGVLLIFDKTNSVTRVANSSPINAPTNVNNESEIASAVRISWQQLTSQAVGDHENCAIDYKLKEEPVDLDKAAKIYEAYYKDLEKTVETAIKADLTAGNIQLLESHMCIYEGRRFAHIVFKKDGKVVSILVTDTDLPTGSVDVMTAKYDENTNAAGMHFGHYALFVVSDLPAADNATLAKRIAPAVRLHTEKLGA